MSRELTNQITNHLNELEQLQKKLDIAINTLKEYANRDNWNHCETENGWTLWFRAMFGTDHFGYRKAEKALIKIELVGNEIQANTLDDNKMQTKEEK